MIADGHDDPLELVARRDRFSVTTFSPEVAPDRQSGIVLLPGERRLRVSHSREDYLRVRVFSDSGLLLGTMACSAGGLVEWSQPSRPRP